MDMGVIAAFSGFKHLEGKKRGDDGKLNSDLEDENSCRRNQS